MGALDEALAQLRSSPAAAGLGGPASSEMADLGISFCAVGGPLQRRWEQALAELDTCIRPLADGPPVLHEGGGYDGAWLESTSTISTEVLARFVPGVATATLDLHTTHRRDDGLIAYKVSPAGPAFTQIQMVSPLARTVWRHHRLTPQPADWLRGMYETMAGHDAWMRRHRDTRGTGCVEAFCTYDTGHDLSPRFWFIPNRCLHGDPTRFDPDSPLLPLLAPDLTANVVSQRRHLALIAAELGEDPHIWEERADAAAAALFQHCFDADAGTFHDRDPSGHLVRVHSDVLLRVLTCDVGDAALFSDALARHLMRTSGFLSHHGFTSIALDDPRFDADPSRNSWAGPVNMLTQLRAPDAFERHGRIAELVVAHRPLVAALAAAAEFPQCLDGWSGDAGFTSVYSPAILFFLDAVERHFGLMPVPGGGVVVGGMSPTRLEHDASAQAVAYARRSGDVLWEVAADDDRVVVHRDGIRHLAFPRGWRVMIDPDGTPTQVTGMSASPVAGTLALETGEVSLTLVPNERVELSGLRVVRRTNPGFVAPHSGRTP